MWLWERTREPNAASPRGNIHSQSLMNALQSCISKGTIYMKLHTLVFNCFRFRVYFQLVICKCCRAIGRTNARNREMQDLTGLQRSVACNSGEYSSFLLARWRQIRLSRFHFILVLNSLGRVTSPIYFTCARRLEQDISNDSVSFVCRFETNTSSRFSFPMKYDFSARTREKETEKRVTSFFDVAIASN